MCLPPDSVRCFHSAPDGARFRPGQPRSGSSHTHLCVQTHTVSSGRFVASVSMEPETYTQQTATLLDHPGTRRAFDTARSGIRLYGALGTAALVAVVAVAVTGHTVNTFMW